MSERPRRLLFGEVAELYDARRPGYPEALIDDLVAWAGRPPRALEVGAGTGKALRQLAQRGVAVVAVEPSPEMAAVARHGAAGDAGIEIVEADFERADLGGRRFPLVYAAQAWHWVDPAAGYVRARAALETGGRLVAFWNRPVWSPSPLRDALALVYDTIVPELPPDGPLDPRNAGVTERDWEAEIAAAHGLAEPEVRFYPWATAYTAEAYGELLGTMSEVRLLDEARRERLIAAVRGAIAEHGGVLELPMRTRTCIARAV